MLGSTTSPGQNFPCPTCQESEDLFAAFQVGNQDDEGPPKRLLPSAKQQGITLWTGDLARASQKLQGPVDWWVQAYMPTWLSPLEMSNHLFDFVRTFNPELHTTRCPWLYDKMWPTEHLDQTMECFGIIILDWDLLLLEIVAIGIQGNFKIQARILV